MTSQELMAQMKAHMQQCADMCRTFIVSNAATTDDMTDELVDWAEDCMSECMGDVALLGVWIDTAPTAAPMANMQASGAVRKTGVVYVAPSGNKT